MLKKKLIPRSKVSLKTREEEREQVMPKRKLLSREVDDEEETNIEDVETEDEVDEEDEVEETPLERRKRLRLEAEEVKPKLKKKLAPPPEDEDETDDEDEEEEPPKKKTLAKKGKKSALDRAFDSVPLTNNADTIPKGTYEAILAAATLQEQKENVGQSVRFNFELVDPDYSDGNKLVDWRRIIDKEGEVAEVGLRILRQELAKLGYEPTDEAELVEVCEHITEEKPGVEIKVFYQEAKGVTYQHVNIVGPLEEGNEAVEAYKDNIMEA
jgi:hypothetical protein